MKPQTLQLFKKLGLDDSKIKEIETKESFDPEEMLKDITSNIRKGAANDPDFITPIRKTGSGEAFQIVKKAIKQSFNLNDDEVNGKDKIEDILEVVKSRSQSSGGKANEELQGVIAKLNKEIDYIRNSEIPQIKSEYESKHNDYVKRDKIKGIVSSFKLAAGEPSSLAILVKDDIEKKYEVMVDDSSDYGIKIRTKNGGLQPFDINGTRELTVVDIVQDSLQRLKFLQQNNAAFTPIPKPREEVIVNTNGNGNGKNEGKRHKLLGQDKAEKNYAKITSFYNRQ